LKGFSKETNHLSPLDFLIPELPGKQLRNESNHQKIRPLKSKYFIYGGANIRFYLDVKDLQD
jgi:hypothetical protein